METPGGKDSKAIYSARTRAELLSLASSMYSLDERARSLLTDELERRSIGPDEIQSYIETKDGKTRRPNPNSGVFAWIWPTIDDEETAEDASARAIFVSAIAVLLGILGSLLHLFGVLSGLPVDKAEILKLSLWVAFTLLWVLVHRGIANESPVWASVGLVLVVLWSVLDFFAAGGRSHILNYGWAREDRQFTAMVICLYSWILSAFVSSIRGTIAYRKYDHSSGNQMTSV